MTKQDAHELGELAQSVQNLVDKLKLMKEERDLYQRLYVRRGQALLRPCMKCGYQPLRIIAGDIEDDNGIKY